MNFAWLKSYMPRSFFGRSLMILLFPVVFLQLAVGLVFIQRHFAQVTQQMTHSVALELDYAADVIDSIDSFPEARLTLFTFARPFDMRLDLRQDKTVTPAARRYFYDISGKAIIDTLQAGLTRPTSIDLVRERQWVHVEIQTRHGALLADIPRGRVSASNPHQLLVLMVVISILLTLVSILFLRNQIRPIRELARVSEAFGKGRSESYTPRGATEVRRAGHAFLAMRARIERQIEQRTRMLSGVSHDLRTPLTRLKLSLAMQEETAETQDMRADVQEMEAMLEGFLSFARGDSLEDMETLPLGDLLDRIVQGWKRLDKPLALVVPSGAGDTRVTLRPDAVVRAVNNLISNAMHHADTVQLEVGLSDKTLTFTVQDDGPGIAPADREEALKPFARLDPARNQNSGSGVGLGLAIAADVARSHGGRLELDDSLLGGLSASLILPR